MSNLYLKFSFQIYVLISASESMGTWFRVRKIRSKNTRGIHTVSYVNVFMNNTKGSTTFGVWFLSVFISYLNHCNFKCIIISLRNISYIIHATVRSSWPVVAWTTAPIGEATKWSVECKAPEWYSFLSLCAMLKSKELTYVRCSYSYGFWP